MPKSRASILGRLLGFLARLFGLNPPRGPSGPVPPDNPEEPAQLTTSRVLLIVYDPVMDPVTGESLSAHLHWNPVGELLTGFMEDIQVNSHGLARFRIVERIDVNEFPPKVDGYQYTPRVYLDVLRGVSSPYMPQEVDYYNILSRFDILERVKSDEIDEVWTFAFPHAGFYESIMAGPDAFWCNAPGLRNTGASGRRFVIMGFSYERGVGEMLESFGHRVESIMEKTFERTRGSANLWKRFIRYEQVAPGMAAVGNIHFAPNSERDYDWNNPTTVKSECYDWLLNFPNFKGDIRQVTASEWGSGDIREHHRWWLRHLPHVAGRANRIHNNWWQYILNPQNVRL